MCRFHEQSFSLSYEKTSYVNYHPVFSRLPGLSGFRVVGFRYWRSRNLAIFVPSALPKPVPADPWQGFQPGAWQECADVEEFITSNYTPYLGDDSSLTGPTERTQALWMQAQMLLQADRASAEHLECSAVDCQPNYLDRREELIVGILDNCPLPVNSGEIDCRAVALYGAARLRRLLGTPSALDAATTLARCYSLDIEQPAADAQQAIQWIYLALLGAYGADCNGPHHHGLDTFLDIYLQRDIERGILIEEEAQELIDDLVIKLRLMHRVHPTQRQPGSLPLPLAGMGSDGRTLVTRTSFRLVNTLYTLGPAADPHFVVLWSSELPDAFRQFCAEVTIDTSSLRYSREPLAAAGSSCLYTPETFGNSHGEQALRVARLLDSLKDDTVVGINVFQREVLEAALARPKHYACLTFQLADHAVDLQSLAPAERKALLHQLLQTLSTPLPAGE